MIKKILIPTDGSDYSRTALEYGIYIAKRLDAQLTGLHVIDIKIVQGPLFSDIAFYSGLPAYYEFLPRIEEALDKRADKILENFEEYCRKSGVVPEIRKVRGIIDEVIIDESENADWTLLAQRGEHFHLSKGGLLGSTAEAVVRKSKKPVLITPMKFTEIESMGLAYDGSAPAENALKIAAELSAATRWPLSVIIITEDQNIASKLVGRIESFTEQYEIDCGTVVLKGREDREILKYIQEGSVELMIMGAFGRGRVKELLLGSTTSYVIRKSTIPVLLTR
ncbi:MAG: universal stress protein [Syntrophales bacterium]